MEPKTERLRRQIGAIRSASHDWRTFASQAATAVVRAVGADGWCVASADPITLLMTGVVADHGEPSLRMFELEYGAPDFLDQAHLARGPVHTGSLNRATHGRMQDSARWRELIEPYGFGDQMRSALVASRGCWGYFAMVRALGATPFSPDEESLVASVGGSIADGIRSCVLTDAARSPSPSAPGLVLLDETSRVVEVTDAAHALLSGISLGDLPPDVVAAVAARARGGDGVATSHTRSRGVWLTLHAMTVGSRVDAEARVAVVIEPARSQTLLDLFTSAAGLTAREAEVVRFSVRGHSTAQIAHALSISPLTVQQHLKSIFGKLGIHSRRELVGLLFERQCLPSILPGPPDGVS